MYDRGSFPKNTRQGTHENLEIYGVRTIRPRDRNFYLINNYFLYIKHNGFVIDGNKAESINCSHRIRHWKLVPSIISIPGRSGCVNQVKSLLHFSSSLVQILTLLRNYNFIHYCGQ